MTLIGATVLFPVICFYHRPKDTTDLLLQVVGRVLDQFHVDNEFFARWAEEAAGREG